MVTTKIYGDYVLNKYTLCGRVAPYRVERPFAFFVLIFLEALIKIDGCVASYSLSASCLRAAFSERVNTGRESTAAIRCC